MMVASRDTSSSFSSLARRWGSTLTFSHNSSAVVGPIPLRYRREMWVGLFGGRSTPWIRGIRHRLPLSLPLLVPRVLANDPHHALAADQLALLAHPLDARSDLHGPILKTA